MDWRNRDYYLVHTDIYSYKMRHEFYKLSAPSIKIHGAHNHFYNKNRKIGTLDYDSDHIGFFVHEMISCKKEESDALEYELSKANRRDDDSRFIKITKEMTGQ